MHTAASARFLDLNQMHAEGITYPFAEVLVVLMETKNRRMRSSVAYALAYQNSHRAAIVSGL